MDSEVYLFENIDKALREKTPYNTLSVDYPHTDIGFKCVQCGVCCRYAGFGEPALNRGDGVCKHFNEDTNLCNIYKKRPLLCNIGSLFEMHFKDLMSKEEYLQDNYNACKLLMEFKKKQDDTTKRDTAGSK